MLTNHKWGLVAFNYGQFHKKYYRYLSLTWVGKLLIQNHQQHVPGAHEFMTTSSNGNLFRVTALCERNSSVTGEFPSQRPARRSFDVFFDLHLNQRLSKESRRRWFETPYRSSWRHCDIKKTDMITPKAFTYQQGNLAQVYCHRDLGT